MSANKSLHTLDAEIHAEDKRDVEHVEIDKSGDRDIEVEYDAQEDKPRVGLRRMLARNPSYEFIREIAVKNQEELNPLQVRSVSLVS